MPLDFAGVAAALLPHAQSFLASWFPEGRLQGQEFCIGDLTGAKGESLKINIRTGRWSDFATGQSGGDLISLYAAANSIDQGEALKRLSNGSGVQGLAQSNTRETPRKPARSGKLEAIIPVPLTAPEPPTSLTRKSATSGQWDQFQIVASWTYRDATGALLGLTARIHPTPTTKDVLPLVYTAQGWKTQAFPEPRPLYNLPDLANRPDAPVLIVEGEKKVEALRTIAPQYVGIAWPGGAQAWRKADWSAIAGRQVLLWPDNDQAGVTCMTGIGQLLLASNIEVKIINPSDRPAKWDAADALEEGWNWDRFKEWAVPRITVLAKEEGNGALHDDENDHSRGTGKDVQAGSSAGALPQGVPFRSAANTGIPAASLGSPLGTGSGPDVHNGSSAPSGSQQPCAVDKRSHPGSATPAIPSTPANYLESPETTPHYTLWIKYALTKNSKGVPLTNLDNAMRIMEQDPLLQGIVWFDEFLGKMLTRIGGELRPWRDVDDINLTRYIQQTVGLGTVSRETISQAVVSIAHNDVRNCAQDWMRSLKWDGVQRLDSFFPDIFGAEDTPYTRAVGRNFWLSIVFRVFHPGCQLKNMVVLEGEQGLGKSPALRIIGGPYFATQHASAEDAKAFAEILQGKFLIEIEEMDAFSKAGQTSIKRAVSCEVDTYRGAYERHAQDHPRTVVMVGTTNQDDWNRDETGADRFWPIRCTGIIDLRKLAQIREQLFAEALQQKLDGARYWEMPGDETRAEQDARFDSDEWLGPISVYLAGKEKVKVDDILDGLFDIKPGKQELALQRRVCRCLKFLKWEKRTKRFGKTFEKFWMPKKNVSPKPQIASDSGIDEINAAFDTYTQQEND